MYPAEYVIPRKQDLTNFGFKELLTADEVNDIVNQEGTTFIVINSICGCAAANARPGAKLAMENDKLPDQKATAFAGVDTEAVNRIREIALPYPPSSPSMALFKDGKLVHFIERHHIEGSSAEMIAANLKMAFDRYC